MIQVNFVRGDITEPVGNKNKLICHCCNDIGVMGSGVALALMKKYPIIKEEYLKWYQSKDNFALGQVQFIPIKYDLVIANLIGQTGIKKKDNILPLKYKALHQGLIKVKNYALENGFDVHLPKIGCGLAGGSWMEVFPMIKSVFCRKDIQVYVYEV